MSLNFEEINAVALANLPSLVQSWFPAGQFRGREYVLGGLHGEPGESLSINTQTGRWADFADGAAGGDPVSLYAAAFTAGKQAEAGRRLAAELGLDRAEPAERARVIAEAREKAPKPDAETWEPMTPDDGALPDWISRKASRIWTYHDATGKPFYHVLRIDRSDSKKEFRGVTFGRRVWTDNAGKERDETGWHFKHPREPLPLYGLDRLAARPDAPVIVCEGEKAADAAGAGAPSHVAVTWPRGSSNAHLADWSPLAGRYVVIWPDNDEPGRKAAAAIAEKLAGVAADVVTLDVSDLEPGADAADLPPDTDFVAWMGAHQPDAATDEPLFEDAPPPEYDEPPPADEPEQEREGVVPLGYDRGHFFYYSRSARQIFDLRPNEHGRLNLSAMASTAGYWQTVPHLQGEKGVRWPEAADWLMDLARRHGIFSPERVRGRGAWLDEGRVVVHLGDRLLVDGRSSPLTLADSTHFYEAAPPLAIAGEPLRTRDAHALLRLCNFPAWECPINGLLLAGWIALAPICGALDWRPAIWITGGAGSGKSTIVRCIVLPALGALAVQLARPTTEAGIRRGLRHDARPVILDESEREDAKAASEMQAIMNLIRLSADDGGEVWKADSSGGVTRARLRAQFMLQSINTSQVAQADVSRITTLALRESATTAATNAAYEEFLADAGRTLTPEFSAGLLARSAKLAPVIRENARLFAAVIAERLGKRRAGDQLGALVAGAFSLHSERVATREEAEEFTLRTDWEAATAGDEVERDEVRLLRTILAAPVRTRSGDVPISRLLESALGQRDDGADLPDQRDAMQLLREAGIRLDQREGVKGVFVATKHEGLGRILAPTAWGAAWSRALLRLPGAAPGKAMRFGMGPLSRTTFVPLSSIIGEEQF